MGDVVDVDFEEIEFQTDDGAIDLDDGVVLDKDPVTGGEVISFTGALSRIDDDDIGEFDDNLAARLDEGELGLIAATIDENIRIDEDTRSEWIDRMTNGMRLMGVADDKNTNEPFPGASRVTHPVLAEAIVQFQARAIKELFPPKGPVKARVLGKTTRELEDARERVEDYMNYQYTTLMPEAFWEIDTLLFYLPMSGSAFKKTYFDPGLDRVTTQLVTAEDLIVPYGASNLLTAPRYTHKFSVPKNDLLKQMRSGQYRTVDLHASPMPEEDSLHYEVDRAEGRTQPLANMDDSYTLYETHIDYDVPGFEDIYEDGMPTGIGLPYVITIEKESQQVLSIRRNWREDDEKRRKRVWFQHYKYLPGMGFYGYGLLHMIGGLSKAATGALRSLMDSAQFSTLQGGFRTKDARVKGGEVQISPGEWKEVEATGDDLQKAFFRPPYAEPSTVMFSLLGFLVDTAQRFATTADAMVGDGDNKGPVGTTLALIEQGSKIFSSIHKRLHWAAGEEFRLVAELNQEHLDGQYDYNVDGASRSIFNEDFSSIGIVPVSDPNIFSTTQRIAQAQAALQMAKEAPQLHNAYEAHRRMYEALDIDDHETLLIDPEAKVRLDPIVEGMAMLFGKPVSAVIDQNHAAHMAVHENWFSTLPPAGQKKLENIYMAHLGEHIAFQYRIKVMQAMGVELPPPPNLSGSGPIQHRNGSELPADVENRIAEMAAAAVQKLGPGRLAKPKQQDPNMVKAIAEIKRKDALAGAETKRKDTTSKADMDRDDAETRAEILRKNAAAERDGAIHDAKGANDIFWNARKQQEDRKPALS